jgi:hypothetical protein
LFPPFWCSADRRVCGPRPARADHGKAADRRTGGLRYQTFCTCRLFSYTFWLCSLDSRRRSAEVAAVWLPPRPAPADHGKAADRRTGGLRYQTFCTYPLFS